MKAGLLNSRIVIRHKVKGEDESGATVYSWQPLVALWADVRHLSGSETLRADAVQNTVRASVRIRFNPRIRADMQLQTAGGALYDIRAVLPDLRGRAFMDLVCEQTGA